MDENKQVLVIQLLCLQKFFSLTDPQLKSGGGVSNK